MLLIWLLADHQLYFNRFYQLIGYDFQPIWQHFFIPNKLALIEMKRKKINPALSDTNLWVQTMCQMLHLLRIILSYIWDIVKDLKYVQLFRVCFTEKRLAVEKSEVQWEEEEGGSFGWHWWSGDLCDGPPLTYSHCVWYLWDRSGRSWRVKARCQ